MIICTKKGQEKGIQIVFAVFVLVIVSAIVITLVVRNVKVPKIKCNQNDKIQSAIMECQNYCNDISSFGGQAALNSAIEFCSKTEKVDWNCDGIMKGEKMSYGIFTSCEDKIPCFELVSCEGYSPEECRTLLRDKSPQKYNQLAYKNFSADCGLPEDSSNWVYKYNFTK